MKTVKSSIKLSGTGLMFAAPVELVIKPSDKKGIRFHINNSIIEANPDNVVSTEHCVILADIQNGAKNKIALVEHFMAACAIEGLEALDIYINSQGFEMPIFDGSAKKWVEEFKKAGCIGFEEPPKPLEQSIALIKGKSSIVLIPTENEKTTITYAVNFKHKDLNNRWVEFDGSNIDEIIEARTFGYLSDLEKFQKAGYSKGVTIENTVGLVDDGTYTTALRSVYEPVKHKILDIIGDLYLTGYNPLKLNCKILVKEAGHGYHVELAKNLKKVLDNLGE